MVPKKTIVTAGPKPPRKKPVRKSPAQKDFPNKLAWLKAMTAYEEALSEVEVKAKIARLDKRIMAKIAAIEALRIELDKLTAERAVLNGDVPDQDDHDIPDEQA